jgi:hypothetical protein
MKSAKLIIFIAVVLLLSSCSTRNVFTSENEEVDIEATVQHKLTKAMTETAEFQTALSAEMTNQAPTITFTPNATITPASTNTPAPTNTPAHTETPTPKPTSSNPWMLQVRCETSNLCVKVQVDNRTGDWAQITLTDSDGEGKFFTVAPRAKAWITLMPGSYKYIFSFCGGKEYSKGFHNLSDSWYILAKCKY